GVSGSGRTVTVQFNAQAAQGTYTLEVAPVIRDVAGNLMDQNGDGTGGQANDRYVATVDLQSPDLTVTSVSGPASARFGDTVNVTWTVRNAGSAPASEHWADRVYLSRDTSFSGDDVALGSMPSDGVTPLAQGGTYTRTLAVTLPLNGSVTAGNY